MIRNDLVSLLKSSSPLDYPILKAFVWFISLCVSFEADLIHSWGTLTLTDIDRASIMKFSVSPISKRGGITGKSYPKHASVHRNWIPPDPYIGSISLMTRRYKETHTRHAGQSHLMRVTWTSAIPEWRHHFSKLVYRWILCSITFNSYVMEVGF